MLEAITNFYTLFPPSSLSFFKVFSQLPLSGFIFVWRKASQFLVFGFSLVIFFMGNNGEGGILKVKQIGKYLVSGLIIVKNVKEKKTFMKTLSLSILQVSFSVSSNSRCELRIEKRDRNCRCTCTKAVDGQFKCMSYTVQNCDINSFWEKSDSKLF
jgi:hypothetical protein